MWKPEQEDSSNQVWTEDSLPVLRMSISLPQPLGESRTARRIRRYYRAQGRAFRRYCEGFLLPRARESGREALRDSRPPDCWEACLEWHLTCGDQGLWSLYTQSREVPGWGTPFLVRRGDVWDLNTGYPTPLSAFFPPHWRWGLLHTLEDLCGRQEAAGVSLWRQDWRRQFRRCFNARNFYLTPDGLVVFYPMYTLGDASEGIPVFSFPYGPEGPFLRPEGFAPTPEQTAVWQKFCQTAAQEHP